MEANGPQQEPRPSHDSSVDHESLQQPSDAKKKKGGWITFPFLGVAMFGLGIARGGATSNLVVYLVEKYNVPRVDAAQISSIALGCLSLAPVGGAIVADAFFGCYPVVAVSMVFSVLSLVVFTLTASFPGLRPAACQQLSAATAGQCSPATTGQMAVLYAGVFLLCVSAGGARFNQATLGASQFDASADRDVLFNWYFVFFNASSVVGYTAIVYLQDTVSWALGYGVSGAASLAGLAALLAGTPYYRRPPPQGSPFTALARVAVAAARKWRVNPAAESEGLGFYHGPRNIDTEGDTTKLDHPSDSFSFLNRAALITDGDVTAADGPALRPWRICTVREVEDFKTLLRITPLWSTSIVLSVALGTQINFTVLQALAMDRALGGGGFTVPASSMIVVILVSIVVSIGVFDRIVLPLCRRLTAGRRFPTPLQRIGAGHVLAVVSLAASAAVERRRLATMRGHGEEAAGHPRWVSPMSAMWLVLPLALAGAGEALYFPGGVMLYYEEFPASLKNTSTGIVAVIIALGFYLSTALVGVVRRTTAWLPNNMNASRLDNLYWLLAVLLAVNFVYYLICARLYRYQNVGK